MEAPTEKLGLFLECTPWGGQVEDLRIGSAHYALAIKLVPAAKRIAVLGDRPFTVMMEQPLSAVGAQNRGMPVRRAVDVMEDGLQLLRWFL